MRDTVCKKQNIPIVNSSACCQDNAAGSEREVEGQPPFSVVIGNSKHVTLQYKGTAVDLSKRSKDDVARVTVE